MTPLPHDDRFPRSSTFEDSWLIDQCFGANPLWLAEWLSEVVTLRAGMRVLDLGCGRAKSSIFLAREFGLDVWAADLWIDPTGNWQTVTQFDLQERVHPLKVDARRLPFPESFFDVIVAVDSMQYYGTDDLFLPYVIQYLKPEGYIGFASAGAVREVSHPVAQHLERFWGSDAWCIRTAEWWREHWGRTGLLNVRSADTMTCTGSA